MFYYLSICLYFIVITLFTVNFSIVLIFSDCYFANYGLFISEFPIVGLLMPYSSLTESSFLLLLFVIELLPICMAFVLPNFSSSMSFNLSGFPLSTFAILTLG